MGPIAHFGSWALISLALLSAARLPAFGDGKDVTDKTLEWRLFDGARVRVPIQVSARELEHCRSAAPRSHGRCVRDGVAQVRDVLDAMRRTLRLASEADEVEAIASLAQSVEFELRRGPHMPLDTLDLWKGDCEDKSILAASLLIAAGHDVVLLKFPRDRHMAVAAALARVGEWTIDVDGRRHTYIECTGYGWRPGRLPPDLAAETPVIIRVPPDTPVRAAATDPVAKRDSKDRPP